VERKRFWNRITAGGTVGSAGVLAKLLISAKAFAVLLKFKTALSMLVSIAAYALFFGWRFAIGFVLMMFVHECGHVVVLRRQGVKASAPMFIPFLGAFVKLQGQHRSVAHEATSALAGPAAGLAVSGVVLLFANAYDSPLLTALAYTGFFMNLFNLVPALPLDGGRVAGALHPALWVAGMLGVLVWMFYAFSPILVLVLVIGGAEAFRRWRAHRRGEDLAYNTLAPITRWKIAGAYVAVAVLCLTGMAVAYTPMSL
jgi:Zn-dependent protease